MTENNHNRRRFLIGSAAVLTTGLAGCTDDESTDDELVIEEDELVEDTFSTYIEGVIRNETGEEQSYVEVKSSVYDEDDVRIDDFFTNTTDLPDGAEWQFEIHVSADAAEIDSYELEASTSPF